jgi:hypothetical protein
MTKQNLEAQVKALTVEVLSGDYESLVATPIASEVSTNEDGMIVVSAESDLYLADYYGEFRGGYPWIHPNLEAFAKSKNMFWDWVNPGQIYLTD